MTDTRFNPVSMIKLHIYKMENVTIDLLLALLLLCYRKFYKVNTITRYYTLLPLYAATLVYKANITVLISYTATQTNNQDGETRSH